MEFSDDLSALFFHDFVKIEVAINELLLPERRVVDFLKLKNALVMS